MFYPLFNEDGQLLVPIVEFYQDFIREQLALAFELGEDAFEVHRKRVYNSIINSPAIEHLDDVFLQEAAYATNMTYNQRLEFKFDIDNQRSEVRDRREKREYEESLKAYLEDKKKSPLKLVK